MPKGVGGTFCSKTGPFFSYGCSKPSGVPVRPRRAKPHSAAKQSRSFHVAALKSASPSINLENMADFVVPNSVHKMCILAWARCQSRGFLLSFRVAALNPSGLLGLGFRVLGSKNGPWSARVCQKRSGPHSAAKQGRSFRVAALKLPGSLYAQGGRSFILQQNMADFVVPNSVHKMCILAWARCQSRGPLLSFRVAALNPSGLLALVF